MLGRSVRALRRARGLSQQELAERSGISRSYLAGIEGNKRNPSLRVIAALARALEVAPAQLLEER